MNRLSLAAWLSLAAIAVGAAEGPPQETSRHEAVEDKARLTPEGSSKGIKACHRDIERFCAGIKAGEGRLGACLAANAKKLSKKCRTWAEHGGKASLEGALRQDIDGQPAPAK